MSTIFIDESGVHKRNGYSTVVLVYIVAENIAEVENAIIEAEKSLRITSFHWARHIWKIRLEFIKALIREDFTVKAAIIENPFNQKSFEKALADLLTEKKIKRIIIDGKKPKRYALRLKKVLRDRGISVKKIKTGNDRAFPCLRLADAFAGLVRAYWENMEDKKARELYKLARKKITTQLVSGQVDR